MVSDSRCLGKIYRDDAVICRQGELGECLYVIGEGQAEVIVRRGDKEFCLGVLEAGDFFGEAELLEPGVRPATLRAVGAAVVLTVDKRTFLHQLHEDPSFAIKIIRRMARRIRHLEQALIRCAGLPACEGTSVASNQTGKRPA